jgi:lysophospholipase L1-like esterase
MKIALIFLSIFSLIFVLLELGLSIFFGLGNPPLYLADEQIGYLLAPNQNLKRFGNSIIVNQFSQRSTFSPSQNTILCLGDSIINGGWWTDQNQTIPSLIQKDLSSNVQVLNASANSWGPRNQLAYLRKFGLFNAKIVILVLNTDDLFAIAPHSLVVGRDRNYPDHKPLLALIELFNLVQKKPAIPELAVLNAEKGDRVGLNLTAIQAMQAIALDKQAQFLLVMTPLLREVKSPGPRDYELKARQRLEKFSQQQQIPYLDFLPIFTRESDPDTLYRDHIHLSRKGNQIVSQELSKMIKPLVPD